MFGAKELKPRIVVTETTVECPVQGCPETVARQRRPFRRAPEFRCPTHKIYISPSTFEYESKEDNLLWHDREDAALLEAIHGVKRESRMARERSEDALTWNVFRYLERHGLIAPYLATLTGVRVTKPQLVYWSYSAADGGTWPRLKQARSEFGERPRRSSEPDLIVTSNEALFLIEPKFTSGNKTKPSQIQDTKQYLTGGNGWYQQVFCSPYAQVAVQEKRYELMRLWLLGSWMAAQSDFAFYLINLVREGQEEAIENLFMPHLRAGARRRFVRRTWEDTYRFVRDQATVSPDRDLLLSNMENKTAGYNSAGDVQLAFRARS
jgi:hypothetical protein